MPARNYWKSGDWNAICDRCGFKFKASELKEEWTGLRVCKDDFELRHPLDFLRVTPDKISVPWTRIDQLSYNTTLQDTGALGSPFTSETTLGGP